ncbi:hypothetical protein E2C01_100058 [Portunus trituberculatus]|uniref:Uncharacterized protein n=1 Tax=Portunus trituberculatus TaxID=210409 RepID=A0A5B7KCB9_PORTR|nr:hypothetical protein [Portunus trituberculatus]
MGRRGAEEGTGGGIGWRAARAGDNVGSRVIGSGLDYGVSGRLEAVKGVKVRSYDGEGEWGGYVALLRRRCSVQGPVTWVWAAVVRGGLVTRRQRDNIGECRGTSREAEMAEGWKERGVTGMRAG